MLFRSIHVLKHKQTQRDISGDVFYCRHCGNRRGGRQTGGYLVRYGGDGNMLARLLNAALIALSVCFLIGFGWLVYSASNYSPTKQQYERTSDTQQKADFPAQIGSTAPIREPHSKKTAPEDYRGKYAPLDVAWNWLASLFEFRLTDVLIAIFTAVLAFKTAGLFRETTALRAAADKQAIHMETSIAVANRSAEAANKAANAAELSAKAAVGVELPVFVLHHLDFIDREVADLTTLLQWPTIEISVKNYGRTPALVLSQSSEVSICAVLPERPEYPSALDQPPERVVERGDIYDLIAARPERDNLLSPDETQAIIDGKIRLWVFGYVRYKDFLGNPHMTRFCKMLWSIPPRGRYRFIEGDAPAAYTESF